MCEMEFLHGVTLVWASVDKLPRNKIWAGEQTNGCTAERLITPAEFLQMKETAVLVSGKSKAWVWQQLQKTCIFKK